MIALFRAIINKCSSKLFRIFLFLSPIAKIKQCLPPALNKNNTRHRSFLRYSWAVTVFLSFVFACQAGHIALRFALTPPPLNVWWNRKTHLKSANAQAQYSEFGWKAVESCTACFGRHSCQWVSLQNVSSQIRIFFLTAVIIMSIIPLLYLIKTCVTG